LAPPPRGATGDGGFRTTPEMMSILGCSAAELGNVLKVLGFRLDRRRLAPDQQSESATAAAPGATEIAAEDHTPAAEDVATEAAPAVAEASVDEGATITPVADPAAMATTPDSGAAAALAE